jgi:hypothetical protein
MKPSHHPVVRFLVELSIIGIILTVIFEAVLKELGR